MAARLSDFYVEIKNPSQLYYDITPDIVSSIKYKYGIFGFDLSDRIADVGTMEFTLKNIDDKYSAWKSNVYNIGMSTVVWLEMEYEGDYFLRFSGHVGEIKYNNPIDGIPTIDIVVFDCMNDMINTTVPVIPIAFDKTSASAIDLLLEKLPSSRAVSVRDTGTYETFPIVFDAESKNASIYSEIYKLIISELGYVYVRHDGLNPELVVLEGIAARTNRELTTIPYVECLLLTELEDITTTEDGYELASDGGGTYIVNEMIDASVSFGKNIMTQVSLKGYPRRVDSGSVVLFELDEPFEMIASGSKAGVKVTYKDPYGAAARVSGKDMIAPVRDTDYKMYQNEDGTGTDLSTNLTVTTVDENGDTAGFGAKGAIYKLVNTGVAGWVTKLQARGYGVYTYNPLETMINSASAIEMYGVSQVVLDQKYAVDLASAEVYAGLILNREKTARMVLENITMIANTTPDLMLRYLYHDVGDLIHVEYSDLGFSSVYFIHGIEAEIGLDHMITYTWTLLEDYLYTTNFFTLNHAVYGLLDSNNVLGF
jgi:hypothetical protein